MSLADEARRSIRALPTVDTRSVREVRRRYSKALAAEQSDGVLRFVLATVPLNSRARGIEAGINAENGASLRVIEKLGFRWVESGGEHGVRWHNFERLNAEYGR